MGAHASTGSVSGSPYEIAKENALAGILLGEQIMTVVDHLLRPSLRMHFFLREDGQFLCQAWRVVLESIKSGVGFVNCLAKHMILCAVQHCRDAAIEPSATFFSAHPLETVDQPLAYLTGVPK